MLVIKIGDIGSPSQYKGIIYLDATTSFDKNFTGRVTSHPIEAGVSVSDHFISENPKIDVSGVISGADISAIPNNILVDGDKVLNANPQPPSTTISDLNSSLFRYLPDSLTQFIPNILPTVMSQDSSRTDFKDKVETLLENVMSGVYYNEERKRWENQMTLITIFETYGSYLGKSIPNLVITGYRVKEDVDSGEGLFIDLSFEQVRFATLESAEAPAPQKGTSTEKAASTSKDKGNVSTKSPTENEQPKKTERIFSTEILEQSGL